MNVGMGVTVTCPKDKGGCGGRVGATRESKHDARVRRHFVHGRECPGTGHLVKTTRGRDRAPRWRLTA